MNNFTENDLEELKVWIEIAKDTSLNGKDLTCYEEIYPVVKGDLELSELDLLDLQSIIDQIMMDKEFFSSLGGTGIDLRLLEKLILFIENDDRIKLNKN